MVEELGGGGGYSYPYKKVSWWLLWWNLINHGTPWFIVINCVILWWTKVFCGNYHSKSWELPQCFETSKYHGKYHVDYHNVMEYIMICIMIYFMMILIVFHVVNITLITVILKTVMFIIISMILSRNSSWYFMLYKIRILKLFYIAFNIVNMVPYDWLGGA